MRGLTPFFPVDLYTQCKPCGDDEMAARHLHRSLQCEAWQTGALFQGRYDSISVGGSEPEYGRVVSDYIHLNPARAGIIKQEKPDLMSYG